MEPVADRTVADGLRPLSVAIVKHAHTPSGGAEDSLREYLEARVDTCATLAHPFKGARGVGPRSQWRVYSRVESVHETAGWRGYLFGVTYYLRDVAETLRRFFFSRRRWDVYVGVDNLNAALGILLRWCGRTRTVIFYVIDYAPRRFRNPLMNALYHALDRFAARRADCVWNVGARMADARAARGLPPERCAPQLTVPVGAPLPTVRMEKAARPTAVFLGHLVPEQGVELLLDAWPRILESVPAATLWVVGSGSERKRLGEETDLRGLNDFVHWLGFVPDDRLHEVLGAAWVAVAPYARLPDGYKQFADPAKLRWYCAAGLPTVITSVPAAAAAELTAANAGVVCEPAGPAIADALLALFADDQRRNAMGDAARRLAADYTWEAIFDRAWSAAWPNLEVRWRGR